MKEEQEQIKIFTPEEANQMLPLVKKIVTDILRAGTEIRSLTVEPETPEGEARVGDLMDELDRLFEEIESLGCFYKDWNFTMGLVDFPAVLDGREIFLCWRSDEDKISFYHDPAAGYDGRKPILISK